MAAKRQTQSWVKNSRGTPANVYDVPEGTSETFKKGALLHYDISENGVVEVARTAGVPDADTFYGIALEDASGTAGTLISVLFPSVDDEFVVAIASDQDTISTPSIDNLGNDVDIIKLSTTGGDGTEYVARPDSGGGTAWGRITRLYGPDVEKRGGINATFSAGDRVVVRFLDSILGSVGQVA